MKTCSQCGRSYPNAQLLCTVCNRPLPKGEAADINTVAHINFLLGELPQWVMAGWMDPKQAQHLTDKYERRRDEMLAGGLVQPAWTAAAAPPVPSGLMAPPPAPSSDTAQVAPTPKPTPLAAFGEDRSLSYWHLIGAVLLLAGLVGLIQWTWASGSKFLVFALMLALTGGLAGLARSRVVRNERITATVLTTLAALLVPLDLFAANAFLLFGGRLTDEGMGLLVTLACLPLYGWMAWRRRSRTFLVLSAVDISAALHFLLQAVLPTLLHTHSPLRVYGVYGLVYAPLAGLYLWAAARDGDPERRAVWRVLMHVTVALAVGISLATGAQTTLGPAAATLGLAGALYAVAAIRLGQAGLATLGVTLGVSGAGVALAAGHVPLGPRWYVYVLTMLGIACALRGLATRLTGDTARAYGRAAFFVASLAAIAQAVRVVAALGQFPAFGFAALELWGALACAVLAAGFFQWAKARGMGDALLAYGVVLLGLLAAHFLPVAAPGNVGLSLALASAGLWALSRRPSALACGWVTLAVCGCYILHGGFLGTSSVALLLLAGLFARGLWVGDAPGTVWLALASATAFVLLWESRGLPPLRARFGLESNNGYGLLLLTLACLALHARRPSPTLRQCAAALGILNAALQMVYAINGGFPYSPLWLLAGGIALTTGIAWVRLSERAAVWATTLLAYAYVTSLAEAFTKPYPGQEALLAGLLLASAPALAVLGQQQRKPFLLYAALLAGSLGWAHGAHRLAHPSACAYALALLPLVAAFCGLAAARARRDDDLWPEPLQNVALLVSVLALLPCLGAFLQSPPPADVAAVTAALLLYGALFAVVAWVQRSSTYLFASATLLNGAYLFGLLHHTPALTRALIAFWLGLAGLAWVGAAVAWEKLAANVKSSLFPVAAGVTLVAAGLAVTDLHGDDALYALLVAGTTFAGIAWGTRQGEWVHLGIGTYLLAYCAWLWERIGIPGMADSDYFLMPIGLYVLALGLLARRGVLDASAPPFFGAGLLLILTPAYLAARQPYADLLHVLLLAGGCLAAIFYGLMGRVKVFLVTGTVFLLLWVQLSLQGVSGQGSWAVSAVLLGLAILGSALYLEKRRDRQTRLTEAAQREWQKWD